MPACQLCQNFFHGALAPFHKYQQNALLDATVALTRGASLTLTSIGRYLPGTAQVKNKIKRIDRLLGNESLHRDIPLIFKNIISMLTSQLSLCNRSRLERLSIAGISRTPCQPALRRAFHSVTELDNFFGKTEKRADSERIP